MIYNIVAFPGRFSEWCERLVYDLAAAANAEPAMDARSAKRKSGSAAQKLALIYGDSLAHIGRELLTRDFLDAVIVSRQPQVDVCRILHEIGRPFLIVLDDPAISVAALMKDHQFDYIQAVRLLANANAALLPLVSVSNALVLRAEPNPDTRTLAGDIAQHFGFQLREAEIDVILAEPHMRAKAARISEVPSAGTIDRPQVAAAATQDAASTDPFARHSLTPLLKGAVEPFWSALQGNTLDSVIWGRELFLCGDNRTESANKPLSLTGPGRCLIFGPYLRLPEGPWSCRIVFGCNERAVGTQMMADAYTGGAVLGHALFQLTESGVFEIEFPFINPNPDAPLEIRLFNTNAALDGQIVLGEVRLSPLEFKRLPITQ